MFLSFFFFFSSTCRKTSQKSTHTKERKIEDVIARAMRFEAFVFSSSKRKIKERRRRLQKKSARAPVSVSSSSSRPTRRALLSSKRRGDRHHRQFYGRPFPVVFASILKTMRTRKGVVVSKRTAGGVFSSTRRDSSSSFC